MNNIKSYNLKINSLKSNIKTCFYSLGFILLLLLISGNIQAQGELQFNRVVLVSGAQTVPAGKVWKVEGAAVSAAPDPPTLQSHKNIATANILINGNTTVVNATYTAYGVPAVSWGTSAAITTGNPTRFPLWLPAGTTLAASTNVVYVSVIEFNVVP